MNYNEVSQIICFHYYIVYIIYIYIYANIYYYSGNNFQVKYVNRKGNKCADKLSNIILDSPLEKHVLAMAPPSQRSLPMYALADLGYSKWMHGHPLEFCG